MHSELLSDLSIRLVVKSLQDYRLSLAVGQFHQGRTPLIRRYRPAHERLGLGQVFRRKILLDQLSPDLIPRQRTFATRPDRRSRLDVETILDLAQDLSVGDGNQHGCGLPMTLDGHALPMVLHAV